MKKILLTSLFASIAFGAISCSYAGSVMDPIYQVNSIEKLSDHSSSMEYTKAISNYLPEISSLKKIFPQLVIYSSKLSKVPGFIKLTCNVGNVYIADKDHILLSAESALLINYQNKPSSNNDEVSKIVSESIDLKITENNAGKRYRYFKANGGMTVITAKNIAKHPYVIMGAFTTMKDLEAAKSRMDEHATGSSPVVSEPSSSMIQSKSDESIKKNNQPSLPLSKRVQKTMSFINENYSQDLVKFKSENGDKGTVYVFTDYTCPHCQELDKHLDKFLKYGFNVDYIMMPRNPNNPTVVNNMQKALCAVNPQQAVKYLYANMSLPSNLKERPDCNANIHDNLDMAVGFKVRGTPFLIGSNGQITSGFESVYSSLQQLNLI